MSKLQEYRDELLDAIVEQPFAGQKTAVVRMRLPYDRQPTLVNVSLDALSPTARAAIEAGPSSAEWVGSLIPAHDTQLAQIRRRNTLALEAEHMLAVVKRFKDLCQAGVIVSKTTQAECDRIIAAVKGGTS
ncbi:hypothetical protein [Variovorax sp. RCC_210]|uniref:hypothetical protein n=1 Tax=Variovorax sp. RCC_210 TaxID=3239217 RepID=UPI00352450BA